MKDEGRGKMEEEKGKRIKVKGKRQKKLKESITGN
jgi:hypothetical protein